MNLKRISGPNTEPVTVADVKLHTHIDYDVEDVLILNWIKAARIAAEDFQGMAYYTQVFDMSFDDWPLLPINVPKPPLVSVDSIKYYDTQNNEYEFDLNDTQIDSYSQPGRISLGYNIYWPTSVTLRTMNAVRIRFTAGYGDSGETTTTPDFVVSLIPENVKDAIYVYCAWRNENRAGENNLPKQFYDILRPNRIVQC